MILGDVVACTGTLLFYELVINSETCARIGKAIHEILKVYGLCAATVASSENNKYIFILCFTFAFSLFKRRN